MLQGFLTKGWMEALIQQGLPSPEQEMNELQEILWLEIIDPLWQEPGKNDNLKKTGFYNEKEAENLNNRIKWYIAHQHEVLSNGDLFLEKIDVGALSTMRKAPSLLH